MLTSLGDELPKWRLRRSGADEEVADSESAHNCWPLHLCKVFVLYASTFAVIRKHSCRPGAMDSRVG